MKKNEHRICSTGERALNSFLCPQILPHVDFFGVGGGGAPFGAAIKGHSAPKSSAVNCQGVLKLHGSNWRLSHGRGHVALVEARQLAEAISKQRSKRTRLGCLHSMI